MPQLDPCLVYENTILILLFFWITTFLFVYILGPYYDFRYRVACYYKNLGNPAEQEKRKRAHKEEHRRKIRKFLPLLTRFKDSL